MKINEAYIKQVNNVIETGGNINIQDEHGRTALYYAAWNGDMQLAKSLIEVGAAVDAKNKGYCETALMVAVQRRHFDMVSLFVESGTDVNNQNVFALLHESYQSIAMLEQLVEAGIALKGEDTCRTRVLLDAIAWYHVHPDCLKAIDLLLKTNIDVNMQTYSAYREMGNTALIVLAKQLQRKDKNNVLLSAAEKLIEAGADVNKRNDFGVSPLEEAVKANHVGMVKLLMKAGVDIQIVFSSGRTALDEAIHCGDQKMIELLLYTDSTMDEKDIVFYNGVKAIINEDTELLQQLLVSGYDAFYRSTSGETWLGVAAERSKLSLNVLLNNNKCVHP
ncbi:ankyrin repeat domain-containing protein [Longirhabdus pacifica]|uniref:ankyrin repeat domain-containing protein n=1 Tax=Longirhabdus pacifica TaxID=2305227 RepID=UPI001008C0E9|nr:ankyrin repeat domain-containing protein [Longirhabdus pacifica]